jgi:hypothetical protein
VDLWEWIKKCECCFQNYLICVEQLIVSSIYSIDVLDGALFNYIKVIWCCIVWLPFMWCLASVSCTNYLNILLEECLIEFFTGVASVGILELDLLLAGLIISLVKSSFQYYKWPSPTSKMAIGENPTLALCPKAFPSLHVQEHNVMIKSLGRPRFLKAVISGAHGWQEWVSLSFKLVCIKDCFWLDFGFRFVLHLAFINFHIKLDFLQFLFFVWFPWKFVF